MESNFEEKVQCIPATEQQKIQYSQHIDGIEFTDKPSVDFPKFSQAQLNSVPDIIDGVPVNEYEKKMILLDSFEYSASSNWRTLFLLDKENYLISKYHDVDGNQEVFETQKNIYKSDVLYIPQNEKELNIEREEKVRLIPFDNDQIQNIAVIMNNYYDQVGESMWNFNHKEGREILEFTLKIKDYPEEVKNTVLDYLNLECPHREMFDNEKSYNQAIQKFNSEEKILAEFLNANGLYPQNYPEEFPVLRNTEVNYLNILLNDVTRILADNNIDLQKEKQISSKPVQQSSESNLSIDNIYGFKPTLQQKEDLNNGKGITGEIQGKNYFIQLSTQEINKGTLQILSMEKAKEFNLLKDVKSNNINQKNTGLRV